ncbi:uncharacterized protein LOC142844415 [Microtus pennsylvanicus]|uniref:uncharacterized protein LOC142844415 n=1 Tax=Microtus pennsylvanicus TaxID=10058 RepID=UPI003F6BD6A4
MGSLGADSPQKIPKEPTPPDIPRQSSAVGTHTPGLTHPLSHAPGRRPLPRPAAPRNFPSCPRAPALVPSPPAPRTHLPRRLSGPRGRDGVLDGPAGAGGAGGARRIPSPPTAPAAPSPTAPRQKQTLCGAWPATPTPGGGSAEPGGFAPPTRRRGRARGTSFLRPPTLGMPQGPGRGRSGGTRTPGVSSGAGSGPLLLSESVSGAPTVCASLGVGRRRATKGASPRTSAGLKLPSSRHSASDSQTARCTWLSMPDGGDILKICI